MSGGDHADLLAAGGRYAGRRLHLNRNFPNGRWWPLPAVIISGPAHVAGNGGRVTVFRHDLGGPASITGNSGATLVAGNSVSGALSCSGNNPAPADGGKPNTSNGPATGQCSGLT